MASGSAPADPGQRSSRRPSRGSVAASAPPSPPPPPMAGRTTRRQVLAAHLAEPEAGSLVSAPARSLPSPSRSRAAPTSAARIDGKARTASRSQDVGSAQKPGPTAFATSKGLKIVLRAPTKPSARLESSEPATSTTTSTPVTTRDSSASSSSSSSRAQTPAAAHPTSAPTPKAARNPSATAPALNDSRMSRHHTTTSRKESRFGPDGLDPVCHMHKSHKGFLRMTCINAPDCRTIWCNKCVIQHYLACTPNNAFEPSSLFLCPVCLDVCLCGNCKRQRRASGRRSVSIDGPEADPAFELSIARPAKKARCASTESGRSSTAPAVEPTRRTRRGAEVPAEVETVAVAAASDSDDEDASVSRLLTGTASSAATFKVETPPTCVEDVKPAVNAPSAPQASPATPAAATAPVTYTLKVKPPRRRNSLDCAYDRASPSLHYRPAPAFTAVASPALSTPEEGATPSPAQSARRRPAAARPPRAPRAPRPVPAPAPAPAVDFPLVHNSLFASTPPQPPAPVMPIPTYNSRPIVPTAAATRSRRTKRPSTAFDDYALDSATSSAAGLGDRYSPAVDITLMGSAASASRKVARMGAASTAASATRPAGAPASRPKRRPPRRYSGLSSASSCDELSSEDDGLFDDLFDDVPVVPMAVQEQPLPVLAGLEQNLEDGVGSAGESLTFDEFGLALSLDSAESRRARPKVKWIEGPERRRRRAMAAAAVAAVTAGETETSAAPTPERVSPVADPIKPHSPNVPRLLLPPPGDSLRPFGRSEQSSCPNRTGPGEFGHEKPRAGSAAPEDQPPPYESHFAAPATSSGARPPASAPAASTLPAPDNDNLRSRSPSDAKLAFALLDAVRAAVAPRDGSSSSGSSATAQGSCAGFGAAIDALFGTSSPVKGPPAVSPVPSRSPAGHVDVDLDAATAEAERRRASLAAAAEVDPVKAFKPLAKDRADEQFFGAPAASVVPLVVEEEEDEDHHHEDEGGPVVSRRDTVDSAFTPGGCGFDDVFEFDIGSPVDDLWTPASVADSVGASARSVSTAPSTAFEERIVAVASDKAGGPLSTSTSATPVEANASGLCASPTRDLLADALSFGTSSPREAEGMLPLPLALSAAVGPWDLAMDSSSATPVEDVCAA